MQGKAMNRKQDLRTDAITAGHIADALKTQAEYGYEKARWQLEALGVDVQLAIALLARRYDRRDPNRPPGEQAHL